MTAAGVEPTIVLPHPVPWDAAARWSRLLLVLGWVFLVAVGVVAGERQSSLHELERAVAAGDVDEVRITDGLGDESRGFATVEVHWRDGLVGRTTQVIEARPRNQAPQRSQRGDDVTGVIGEDLGTRLQSLQHGLNVVRVGPLGSSSTVLGWQLPGWTGLLLVLLWFCTVVSMIFSPVPWRATRWAWFWLMTIGAPVGVAAYLLLAGPTPGLPAPSNVTRRLTGGWAILLALIGSSVVDLIVANL